MTTPIRLPLLLTILLVIAMSWCAHAMAFTARALEDEIIDLPGAPKNLPFRQFSGYIDVEDDVGSSSIFYWLVTSIKTDPISSPLTWWSNGGPGCSGLTGILTSNGPFILHEDGSLTFRDYPWNDYSNVVFVEQPDVGFTRIHSHNGGFWTDEMVAQRNALFIKHFFERYPQFKPNPFFIASQSYGGHYLPTLSNVLIRKEQELGIDYRGLFVGNPLIYQRFRDFGFFRTLIDRQLIPFFPLGQKFIERCAPDVHAPHVNPPTPPDGACWDIEMKMRAHIRNIDVYALSFPVCVNTKGELRASVDDEVYHMDKYLQRASREYTGYPLLDDLDQAGLRLFASSGYVELSDTAVVEHSSDNHHTASKPSSGSYFPSHYEPCDRQYLNKYFNLPEVQRALHVVGTVRWSGCKDINYRNYSINESMIKWYKENHALSNGRIKSLLFSGNDDSICSTVEAQMALFNSNLTMHDHPWRDVVVDGQLIGHRTDFDELSFVTVNGAGHVGSATRPYQVYTLFNSFISGRWFS